MLALKLFVSAFEHRKSRFYDRVVKEDGTVSIEYKCSDMGLSSFHRFIISCPFTDLLNKIHGWGASVFVIGVLFKIMHWSGDTIMQILGCGAVALILVMFLIRYLVSRDIR